MKNKQSNIALFEKRHVRRVWHEEQWWFVITDVIVALTESVNSTRYLKNMRARDESFNELFTKGGAQIEPPLAFPFQTTGGKQKLLCWNTEGLLRMIQSIPSPKAEPFKRWLAKIGKERLDEINNPELAMERMRQLYEKKGYPKDWVEKRVRGIAVRQDLTREWQGRGVTETVEFAILTNEIMQGTFGMKVQDYKEYKGIEKENLRDHMNDIELILTMLAEATTTKLHKDRDSRGMPKLKKDAQEGGAIAGRTRKDIEKSTKKKVTSKENYLPTNSKKLK